LKKIDLNTKKIKEANKKNLDSGILIYKQNGAQANFKFACRKSDREQVIKDFLKSKGSDLCESYSGLLHSHKVNCAECGTIFERRLSNALQYNSFICLSCRANKRISLQELKLKKALEARNINFVCNKYLGGQELDFFFPEYNVGLEINGIYWHSEERVGKYKHYDKKNYFLKKGIEVYFVFDIDVDRRLDLVMDLILAKLGKINKRIYARNTEVDCDVSHQEICSFLSENHLAPNIAPYKHATCLRYGGVLVCLALFGKYRFNKGVSTWELIRFATKRGIIVPGGLSKLLNFAKTKFGINKIISFADRMYSNGNIYKRLGFDFEYVTKPNYYYFKSGKLYHRVLFQKHKLAGYRDKNLYSIENFDPILTEYENMRNNGFIRIFDCGHIKFSKTL